MNFTVAPRKVSYKFAWEIDCPDLEPLSGPPVALHSAWLFMNRKIIYGLIETNLLDTDDRLLRLPTTVAEINSLFNKPLSERNSVVQDAIKTNLESLSQEMWDLLESKDHSIDNNNQGILDTLSKLGLGSKDDIQLLSPEGTQQISNFLKLVPKKKFLSNMSKIKSLLGQK